MEHDPHGDSTGDSPPSPEVDEVSPPDPAGRVPPATPRDNDGGGRTGGRPIPLSSNGCPGDTPPHATPRGSAGGGRAGGRPMPLGSEAPRFIGDTSHAVSRRGDGGHSETPHATPRGSDGDRRPGGRGRGTVPHEAPRGSDGGRRPGARGAAPSDEDRHPGGRGAAPHDTPRGSDGGRHRGGRGTVPHETPRSSDGGRRPGGRGTVPGATPGDPQRGGFRTVLSSVNPLKLCRIFRTENTGVCLLLKSHSLYMHDIVILKVWKTGSSAGIKRLS